MASRLTAGNIQSAEISEDTPEIIATGSQNPDLDQNRLQRLQLAAMTCRCTILLMKAYRSTLSVSMPPYCTPPPSFCPIWPCRPMLAGPLLYDDPRVPLTCWF